jgi:hypothetical protein
MRYRLQSLMYFVNLLSANAGQRQRISLVESALADARRERNDVPLALDPCKGDFARLETERDSLRDSSARSARRSRSLWLSWRRG